jgi:hypothetical protein
MQNDRQVFKEKVQQVLFLCFFFVTLVYYLYLVSFFLLIAASYFEAIANQPNEN